MIRVIRSLVTPSWPLWFAKGGIGLSALMAVSAACITLLGSTTVVANVNESHADSAYQVIPPESLGTFGVAGSGAEGICSEIQSFASDPPRIVDCEKFSLHTENIDIDNYPTAAPWADLLVENQIIRANKKAYFQILDSSRQPSYRGCASGGQLDLYWIPFSALPGRTVCLHSDEGRVGILQTEEANGNSAVIVARFTVWEKS
jgi:hypothetical protein